MSRDKKFRAWDKEEECWLDPKHFYITGTGEPFTCQQGRHNITCRYQLMGTDRYIVEQFANHTDKDGEDVYAGDIFKVIYSDTPNGFKTLGGDKKMVEVYGVVVYKWSGFYIEHKEPVNGEIRYGSLHEFLKNPKEIIGTIHTHKELLNDND